MRTRSGIRYSPTRQHSVPEYLPRTGKNRKRPHPTPTYLPAAHGLGGVLSLVVHGAAEKERQLPDVQEGVLVGEAHVHAIQLQHAPWSET